MSTRMTGLCFAAAALGLCSAALAQGGAELLKQVPQNALGFVVINDVKGFTAQIDQGIKPAAGEKPAIEGAMLDQVKAMLGLSETYTGEGALGLVMLDPRALGVDLLSAIKLTPPAAPVAGAPAKAVKLPLLICVAARDVKSAFGQAGRPSGKYVQLELPFGYALAGKIGNFVVASPTAAALDAMSAEGGKLALPADTAAAFASADVFGYVHMGLLSPILEEGMKTWEIYAAATWPDAKMPIRTPLGVIADFKNTRQLLPQIKAVSFTVKKTAYGLGWLAQAEVTPDSSLGRLFAAAKPAGPPAMDRLPSLPHILIGSAARQDNADFDKLPADIFDRTLDRPDLAGMSVADKDKARAALVALRNQVLGGQFAIAAGTAADQLMQVSAVLKCKSSSAAKDAIAQLMPLLEDLARAKATAQEATVTGLQVGKPQLTVTNTGDPAFKDAKAEYKKAAETVGGVSADAIIISLPNLANLGDARRAGFKQTFGIEGVRVLLASPDDTTLVVAMGAPDNLAKALAGAKGGAALLTAEEQSAVDFLGKDLLVLLSYSAANRHAMEAKSATTKSESPAGKLATSSKNPFLFGLRGGPGKAELAGQLSNQTLKQMLGNLLGP